MSLFVCHLKKGVTEEAKRNIRREICTGMGELTGIDARYFAVLFNEYEPINFSDQGIWVFVELCQTEGRDDLFKDQLAELITGAFCRELGWNPEDVSIMIHDILRGSMGNEGRIVNRGGAFADTVKENKTNF